MKRPWRDEEWFPAKLASVIGMDALRLAITGKSQLFTAEEIYLWLRLREREATKKGRA